MRLGTVIFGNIKYKPFRFFEKIGGFQQNGKRNYKFGKALPKKRNGAKLTSFWRIVIVKISQPQVCLEKKTTKKEEVLRRKK